jgi:hypothetical protein
MTPADWFDVAWKLGGLIFGGAFLWFKVGALTREVGKMPDSMDKMRVEFSRALGELRVEFMRSTEKLTDTVNDHGRQIAALDERTRKES